MKFLQQDPWPDLELDVAIKRVRGYFDPQGKYAGRRFEFLGGGGDRPATANVFTPEDHVAVSMLSVYVPNDAAITILESRSLELTKLLSQIPNEETLWETDVSNVDDEDSNAAKLWAKLETIEGVGWVTANKLLARKRPQLLPVYDRIVKARLQPRSSDLWIPLRNSLLRDEGAMIERLAQIRSKAELDVTPSLLRVLDVAMWMTAKRD